MRPSWSYPVPGQNLALFGAYSPDKKCSTRRYVFYNKKCSQQQQWLLKTALLHQMDLLERSRTGAEVLMCSLSDGKMYGQFNLLSAKSSGSQMKYYAQHN